MQLPCRDMRTIQHHSLLRIFSSGDNPEIYPKPFRYQTRSFCLYFPIVRVRQMGKVLWSIGFVFYRSTNMFKRSCCADNTSVPAWINHYAGCVSVSVPGSPGPDQRSCPSSSLAPTWGADVQGRGVEVPGEPPPGPEQDFLHYHAQREGRYRGQDWIR